MTVFNETNMRNMRRLGIVNRWQLAPVIRRESVLEHSVTVLMIYGWLCERWGLSVSYDDAFKVLMHDSDEAITGDAPSTNNKTSAAARAAICNDARRALLKAADYLESVVYLNEEHAMGNTRVEPYLTSTIDDYYYPWAQRAYVLVFGEDTPKHESRVSSRSTLRDIYGIYSALRHPSLEG